MTNWEAQIKAAFNAGAYYALANSPRGKEAGLKADDCATYIAKLKAKPLVARFDK